MTSNPIIVLSGICPYDKNNGKTFLSHFLVILFLIILYCFTEVLCIYCGIEKILISGFYGMGKEDTVVIYVN